MPIGSKMQMEMFQEPSSAESIEETKETDLFLLAAVGSVLFALYEFYINDDPERAIFIGHWPPTILAFAIYLRGRMKSK